MLNEKWKYSILLVDFGVGRSDGDYNRMFDYYDADDSRNFEGIVITIDHDFWDNSELESFKGYVSIVSELDKIIDRAIESGTISEVVFVERSNAEINCIVRF